MGKIGVETLNVVLGLEGWGAGCGLEFGELCIDGDGGLRFLMAEVLRWR